VGELRTLSRAEIATTLRRHALLERLSGRDLEVLRRLARGQTQRAIAPATHFAPRTVSGVVAWIEEVLGAVNPTNAVALAYEAGVLTVGDAHREVAGG
jgi:two-component system, NarL family, response regulator